MPALIVGALLGYTPFRLYGIFAGPIVLNTVAIFFYYLILGSFVAVSLAAEVLPQIV